MLETIVKRLQILKTMYSDDALTLAIPSVWCDIKKTGTSKVNFCNFIIQQIHFIESQDIAFENNARLHIYNLMPRLFSAFDHYQDGKLENIEGKFKETGTFLKLIALLPYIKQLGTNVLYMLPITSIGQYGKKGDLGSPYSIASHYALDRNLSEPLLGMSVEEQFKAVVTAAHKLGMRVICEFIFRTASRDTHLTTLHPEWFYWLKKSEEKNYYAPHFKQSQLDEITNKISNNNFTNLPEPSIEYQKMFTKPPDIVELIDGRIEGTTADGKKVVIPTAFADYPPNDKQPAWTDVTYLKLYDNPDFNYIAYNTIRMYDENLKQPLYEQTPLWRYIESVIPHYQKQFGIDGVMIDMGHALPEKLLQRIIAKAKRQNKDFILFEENFMLSEKSVKQGFDAVLGCLIFGEHIAEYVREFIVHLQHKLFPIPCFATSENHNTPRTAARQGGTKLSRMLYVMNKLLPLPLFIHSGYELGETLPINTGLGFEDIDTKELTTDILPLFSTSALKWLDSNFCDFILKWNDELKDIPNESISEANVRLLPDMPNGIVAFERLMKNEKIIFYGNWNNETTIIKGSKKNIILRAYDFNIIREKV